MWRSHHLVHCSPCLQTQHRDETNRFGYVSLRLWFVLLGCVWCVRWVGWPSACCSCWHWLCRGWAGELELDGLAAGGCGRAPRPLARCSPCKLASPIANHEHAPARAAIYSAHLHRHRGLVPWPAVQWAFAAAAAGVSAAAEADGNSGLLASNRTAPGAGTRPLTRPCLCASVFSSWDVLMNTMHVYARSPQKSKSYKPTRHEKRTGTRDNEAQSA